MKHLRCRLCAAANTSTMIPHDEHGEAKMRAHLETVHGTAPGAVLDPEPQLIRVPPAVRLDRKDPP